MSRPIYHTATDQRVEQSEAERAFMERLQAAGVPVVHSVKLANNWVFDGAINGTRMLVEYHGSYWHERPEVKARDQRKQEWADQEGYLIVTVWEHDEKADPDGEVARVVEAYRQAKVFADREARTAAADTSDTPAAIAAARYGDWRDRFLVALGEGGIVREACIAASVSRQTAYVARADDPAFAELWRLAMQDAADKALAEYRKRAMQQSDRAMEFFITTRDPEVKAAAQRVEITGANGGPIDVTTLTDAERAERAAAIFERARARRAGSAADQGAE